MQPRQCQDVGCPSCPEGRAHIPGDSGPVAGKQRFHQGSGGLAVEPGPVDQCRDSGNMGPAPGFGDVSDAVSHGAEQPAQQEQHHDGQGLARSSKAHQTRRYRKDGA